MTNFIVKKVAVLGAGVMGAQIAAHCVNAKVPVVLFDLPAKEGPKNGIVLKAIEGLKKLSPAPLGNKDHAALIEVANYEDDLAKLATARFYFARLQPETATLIRQARSGSANLMALDADLF